MFSPPHLCLLASELYNGQRNAIELPPRDGLIQLRSATQGRGTQYIQLSDGVVVPPHGGRLPVHAGAGKELHALFKGHKTVIEYTDTTLANDSQKTKWPLNFPDIIYNSNYNNLSYSNTVHGDLPVFPAFRYQVLVTGIKYDEPLVIEDSFDTSKFALLTGANL